MHEANRLSPAGAPRLGFALTILAAALLAACNPGGRPGARDLSLADAGRRRGPSRAAGEATEQIGTGSIKIALIVPLTQASGPSVVGASLRNAAQLAYIGFRRQRRQHSGEGRSLHAGGRRRRGAERGQRGRGNYSGAGLRRRRQGGRRRRARRRTSGDRLLHGHFRGGARRAICCRSSSRTTSSGSFPSPPSATKNPSPRSFQITAMARSRWRSFSKAPPITGCAS